MPFYLEINDDISELSNFKSILIIPCRFCPAASTAVRLNEPYFDFMQGFLKTPSYEKLLKKMKSNLEKQGIKTDIVGSISPHNFTMCMWTEKQRNRISEKASTYEALVVLGCEAAVKTISESVKSTSCKVFQGMTNKGVMSVKPRVHFPLKLSLEKESVTPILYAEKASEEISR
jgi:hypothetical protein